MSRLSLVLLGGLLALAPAAAAPRPSLAVQAEEPYPLGWDPLESFQGQVVDTVQERFQDGRLRRIATYLSGRRDPAALHGREWTYWPNNTLRSQRTIVLGKLQGPAANFHDTGMPESSGEYAGDDREGRWSFFQPNGKLHEVRDYEAGQLHGLHQIFFPSGDLKQERRFEHGLQVGTEYEWDNDGNLLRQADYQAGRLHGTVERTDVRGLRFSESWEAGKKEGLWRRWDEGGVLVLEESYHADQLHGLQTRWRADGTLATKMTYAEGRLEGELIAWHDNGQMQMRGALSDGKRLGPWTYWRRDGSIIASWSGVYEDDRKVADG